MAGGEKGGRASENGTKRLTKPKRCWMSRLTVEIIVKGDGLIETHADLQAQVCAMEDRQALRLQGQFVGGEDRWG